MVKKTKAKKKKTKASGTSKRGRPFEQGNAASKGRGRPPMPEDLKATQELTPAILRRKLSKYLGMTKGLLLPIIENEYTPRIDVIIARIVYKAASGADEKRLDFLLNRLIGKVAEPPKEINLNLSGLPKQELIEIGKQAVHFLEANPEEAEVIHDSSSDGA